MATDQEIRDAGFKYIPQQKYLLNPFQIPTTDDDDDGGGGGGGGGGIPFTNAGDGFNPYNTDMSNVRQDYNAFPSRQAGEIYSKTFNPQPYGTGVESAQAAYNQANQALAQGMDPNSQGYGSFTGGTLAGLKDIANEIIMNNKEQYGAQGQYIDPYDATYSSITGAQKAMDNYPDYFGVPSGVPEPGIPAAIKRYMENSLIGKGFGMAKDFLGRVMPINERAIMENEARGAGIFTDDIGRIVTDDYNTAGGIMAGYNLNKIDAGTFDKRRSTIKGTIADKKAKGLDTTALEERLGLLDDAEEDILGAKKKTKQVYKMRKDKKTKDKKKKTDDTTGTDTTGTDTPTGGQYTGTPGGNTGDPGGNFANIDNSGKNYGPYSKPSSAPQYNRQDDNRESQRGSASNAPSKSSPSSSYSSSRGSDFGARFHGEDGGRVYFFDGGRVAVMNGGLISLL